MKAKNEETLDEMVRQTVEIKDDIKYFRSFLELWKKCNLDLRKDYGLLVEGKRNGKRAWE